MSVSSPPRPSPSSPPPRLPSPCPVAILCVQCGMSDLNCDPVSSVWRAGLQPRSCECSVAYRTPTAILRVQCGVPDPNCDLVCSVLCAGPQLRFCEFSVAYRTPTAILRVQCGVPERMCQREWSKICQECQMILLCLKEVQRECLGQVVRIMFKNMSARMSARSGGNLK